MKVTLDVFFVCAAIALCVSVLGLTIVAIVAAWRSGTARDAKCLAFGWIAFVLWIVAWLAGGLGGALTSIAALPWARQCYLRRGEREP